MKEEELKSLNDEEVEDLKEKLFYIGYRVAKGGQESMDLEAIARYVLMNVYARPQPSNLEIKGEKMIDINEWKSKAKSPLINRIRKELKSRRGLTCNHCERQHDDDMCDDCFAVRIVNIVQDTLINKTS
jgi:hypothetical protein